MGSDNEGSWEPKSDEEAIEVFVDDGVVQKDIQASIVEEVPPHLIVYKISARLMNSACDGSRSHLLMLTRELLEASFCLKIIKDSVENNLRN